MTLKNADSDFSPRISPKNWLLPVINNQNTPPTTPHDGDRYRITAVATGLWTGQENTIAVWEADAQKWRFAALVEPQIWYDFTNQNWHYMSNAGVITQFDKIPLAESDVTGLIADLASKAPIIHKPNHVVGGSDAFVAGDLLDATAKHNILNAGALVATRRGINLIPGANIALGIVDNSGSERVDVTITAAVGGAHPLLDGVTNNDTVAVTPVSQDLIYADSSNKWDRKPVGANNTFMKVIAGILTWSGLLASDIPNIAEGQVTNLVADLASKQPNLGYTAENLANKNQVNGYAPLNANALIDNAKLQNPTMDYFSNQAYSPASTEYVSIVTGVTPSLTESVVQVTLLSARIFSKLSFQVDSNSATGVSTMKLRKNAVDTLLAVSIPAGNTGVATDLVDTVSFAPNDKVCYVVNPNGGPIGGNMHFGVSAQ